MLSLRPDEMIEDSDMNFFRGIVHRFEGDDDEIEPVSEEEENIYDEVVWIYG